MNVAFNPHQTSNFTEMKGISWKVHRFSVSQMRQVKVWNVSIKCKCASSHHRICHGHDASTLTPSRITNAKVSRFSLRWAATADCNQFCTDKNVPFFSIRSVLYCREHLSDETLARKLLQPKTLYIYCSTKTVATSATISERVGLCPQPSWTIRCLVFSNRTIILMRISCGRMVVYVNWGFWDVRRIIANICFYLHLAKRVTLPSKRFLK